MGDESVARSAPRAGERLLALASCLQREGRLAAAALAFHSAGTSSFSGLAPGQRAHALLCAARLLVRKNTVRSREKARAILEHAYLMLRSIPGGAQLRLHVGALLEAEYANEGASFGRPIFDALEAISCPATEVPEPEAWWVYYKAREVVFLLNEGKQQGNPTRAGEAALAAAENLEPRGDILGAAAFILMDAQIRLARVGAAGENVAPHVLQSLARVRALCQEFRKSVSGTEHELFRCTDLGMLEVMTEMFSMLSFFRIGRTADGSKSGHALMCAFDAASRASSATEVRATGHWKWLQGRVLRAFVEHLLSYSARMNDNLAVAEHRAGGALHWSLLKAGCASQFFSPKLSLDTKCYLAFVMYDNAARVKLCSADLKGAWEIIQMCGGLERVSGVTLTLATKASIYLLFGEYYMLRGNVADANKACKFFSRIIESAKGSLVAAKELGDITHMARTYCSLLLNERRFEDHELGSTARISGTYTSMVSLNMQPAGLVGSTKDIYIPSCGVKYVNALVLAGALFAQGVYDNRGANVLDAKNVSDMALTMVHPRYMTGSPQLAANVCIALASVHASLQNSVDQADLYIDEVLEWYKSDGDLITRSRWLRARKKIVTHKPVLDSDKLAQVQNAILKNDQALEARQGA